MGNSQSIGKVNFEDVYKACNNIDDYCIINTLQETAQGCLINGTIDAQQEEKIINNLISRAKDIIIIIYGRNCNDETIYKKLEQLNITWIL